MQELWDQIKSSSSEDSKLQGMVESLEKMLHDSESKYQVSKHDAGKQFLKAVCSTFHKECFYFGSYWNVALL